MNYEYWHKQVILKLGTPFTEYPVNIETEWHTLVLSKNNGEFLNQLK
jgi:hypothetical protein